MRRTPLLRLPSPRVPVIVGVAAGAVLPVAATLLLPLATLPPVWRGLGSLAAPALALSLVALAGVLASGAVHALIGRDLIGNAFRLSLAVALFSPIGASLAVPAALALLRFSRHPRPRAANDNARLPRPGARWVPVTPERARLARDQSVA